jgi:pilus assembly protein CpaB
MSPVRILILVGAAAAAGGAAFLMRGLANPKAVQPAAAAAVVQTQEVEMTKVLVAKSDLKIGDIVSSSDLEWAKWPEKNVAEGYLTDAKAPTAIEDYTGAVVKMPVYKKEPIYPTKLVKHGETGTMTALIEPNMRSFAFEISEETASAGFILPNDRVDVILTYNIEKFLGERGDVKSTQSASTTLVQNVRVLAIDQTLRNESEDGEGETSQIGNTATLEVTAQEAELLALALHAGEIFLALRPWTDSGPDLPRRARLDLLANPEALQDKSGIKIIRSGKEAAKY